MMVLMRLESYVFQKLSTQSIAAVRAQNILALFKPIQEQEKYETASRVLMVCRQVCCHAIATRRITHDPSASVRPALTPVTPFRCRDRSQGDRTALTDARRVCGNVGCHERVTFGTPRVR